MNTKIQNIIVPYANDLVEMFRKNKTFMDPEGRTSVGIGLRMLARDRL